MASSSSRRHRSGDQRARVMALTRAAYTVAEGGIVGADVVDASDGVRAIEAPGEDPSGAGRRAPGEWRAAGGAPRHPRRRLSARAAIAAAVVLALVTAVLVVRAAVTAASIVEIPGEPAGVESAESPIAEPTGVGEPSEPGEPTEPAPTGSTGSTESTESTEPGGPGPADLPSTPPTTVVVHVSGHVVTPGVVTLPGGARVQDAVTAAGGAGPEADLGALNLARVLVDGEQVRVPAPGEEPLPAPPTPPAGGAGQVPPGGASGAGPVDLNAATLDELDALPGIGPAIAQRIVTWREANGGFREVAELDEVSGIGPSLMDALTPLVTV